MGLKFQNHSFDILCKITSWLYEAGSPVKKTACFMGQPWKKINFICKNFLIGWNRVNLHSPSPASSAGLLAYFCKMPFGVGQLALGFHIFRNLTEEKINMTPVNASKSGPIICVNRYYTETEWFSTFAVFIPWEFSNRFSD